MEKKISIFCILYFSFGLFFAIGFAVYYHWPVTGFLSPGFYMVIFTWPYQAIGFVKDILYYGLTGKPV
ncbi:hypothetical protein A2631_03680 [Candidatus Daviesbacteria bacterium RIFCSPHIGHO2_01_FULL_44_29]|uniref:Uncharacterized protein n=1 Tax=Candidatus Daviesbacteria bacterium RIFCSPHIGHO2_02_FULL_43_12 TaxID=1797776 RepID=A0A1F5KI13_9BACT|nr:MAG: hypothetical protein A2631_03680 [Candidatus Daviesbacteria bacterium RIFCSPHIGHO2_01_FULL_44_29]OGE39825.1 MAG: hypothetical protein A3E86_04625 [Candidatus Daviesbacteria bacterium RIFCSPHIGHO2_12_FULL_47_45]OGE40460.1 MAG: hypothetical protein A3D25_00140 [Candidatus Daviesbacteria bacterium RIFCSPHIGHO2_02_FULL_43_12]OGE70011.1 MAG: hypothetical protein A3B55_04945 [Candidatus Daviesbacteria bacterium RIFCSPLOWO2_01_FULL_43_15]